MTGLVVLSHSGAALAVTEGDPIRTTVLHPTVTGTGGEVRYSLSSLAGGGVQLSFVLVPDEDDGQTSGREAVQSKEFTLSVDAKAVATQTVTDDGGTVVPAASEGSTGSSKGRKTIPTATPTATESATTSSTKPAASGSIVEQDVAQDSTEVTLKATTGGVATVWVLPQQAPAAADPDDQGWVSRTWHALIDKITGDDSDSSSDTGSGDDQDASDSGDAGGADDAAPTAVPTSAPTTTPSATSTSSSSPSSPSTTEGSSRTPGTGGDQGDSRDGACVVTQGQLTTSTADDGAGDGTVDAPLQDGPSAAPTFSEEVRKKAAEQASDCGEGPDGAGTSTGAPTSTPSTSSTGGKTKVDLKAGDWLSGISGEPGDRAAVEKLRGQPAEVATTWTDYSGNADQLSSGAEFGPDKWDKSLIIAMPPFPQGSSWEATAAGDNDEYLHHAFATLKSKWAGRSGQAFIEYGYEANGYWMSWAVKAGQEDAWAKAFARARAIQQEEFPDALLGVRFNHESNGYDGDSHKLLQAIKDDIDFMGTSYYNAYPPVSTQAEFAQRAQMLDGGGGPKGIDTWLAAAKEAGLPIEFAEWAESAKDGDSPAFIDGMHQTFKDNAGPGAGQVFAESYFQVLKDDDNWRITSGRVPQSASEYAKQFSDVG